MEEKVIVEEFLNEEGFNVETFDELTNGRGDDE